MAQKSAYVETAAINYLTAKPSSNIIKLARQHLTRQWWERRSQWRLFISPLVLEEIADGDPAAADKRLEAVRGLSVLPDRPEIEVLIVKLVAGVALPEKARADATHLALAALHRMDYLVTWNMKHLDNPELRAKIDKVIRDYGLSPAQVVTPERLLEMNDD